MQSDKKTVYSFFCIKQNIKSKLHAFTLAEILISLGIIGIVAAITIPIVNRAKFENEVSKKLNKNYSLLLNITNTLISNEGAIESWNWAGTSDSDIYDIFQLYKSKMISNKECHGTPQILECFNANLSSLNIPNNNIQSSFLTSDGTSYSFIKCRNGQGSPLLGNCGSASFLKFKNNYTNVLGYIIVDINGLKHPNKLNYDVHIFGIDSRVNINIAGARFPDIDCYMQTQPGLGNCTYQIMSTGKFSSQMHNF